ncbi:hypothetical protein PILCRDRAFT_484446 [Piloderma croceum F 1598]|uniref:DUF676 domain-containing protein n=1 Tax=Piloderma croceum (strain F 1598) TaxID=765440 RepID=A0A0C3B780_PILCF|nr:hypothetical protein PILCRDRAFT_484446 [Piloderma croceum F 1598]
MAKFSIQGLDSSSEVILLSAMAIAAAVHPNSRFPQPALYISRRREPSVHSFTSIVAVHGLDGEPNKTWTDPKTKAFWIKDFLPQDVPDARILNFGYNASAAFGNTTAEVIDHAKDLLSSLLDKREEEMERRRPLIFIAHSLGGIIVKQGSSCVGSY